MTDTRPRAGVNPEVPLQRDPKRSGGGLTPALRGRELDAERGWKGDQRLLGRGGSTSGADPRHENLFTTIPAGARTAACGRPQPAGAAGGLM
jgi:hypothetical protein